MRPSLPAALALLACAAVPAAGQTHDTSNAFRVSPDCVIPDSDTKRVPVYTWVDLPDSAAPAVRALAENLMQDIVERIPALLGARPDVLPNGEPSVRWLDLGNPLQVTGYRTGRMSWRPFMHVNSGAADLLGRALAASVADGTAFPWDSSMAGDSISFRIAFVWPRVDVTGLEEPIRVRQTAIPAFSVVYPMTRAVQPEPGNRPPPYPDDAVYSGFNGTVLMQFVVDTSGRADMTTAHDLWPGDKPRLNHNLQLVYNEFVQEVLQRLPEYRFQPATIGRSCRVRQLVQMPFEFTHSP